MTSRASTRTGAPRAAATTRPLTPSTYATSDAACCAMDGEMPKKAPKTAERATPALTTFARIIAQLPGSRSSRTDGLPAQTALGDCPDHPNGNCERGWHGSESGDVIAITKYRPSWPSRRIVGLRFRFRL